jgi:hypothetical protein
VVTEIRNGTLTIQPDPVTVEERRAAIQAAAAENELTCLPGLPSSSRRTTRRPLACLSEALPAFVNAIYNQMANERFLRMAAIRHSRRPSLALLGLEPGSNFTEAQLYRLLALIPDNLEVRAAFAPVLSEAVRESRI